MRLPATAAALDGLTQAGQAGDAARRGRRRRRRGEPPRAGPVSRLSDAQGGLQDGSGLAVIAELADDVRISRTAAGISVCMSWPSSARER